MAPHTAGSSGDNTSAVPVAYGGTLYRTEKGYIRDIAVKDMSASGQMYCSLTTAYPSIIYTTNKHMKIGLEKCLKVLILLVF